MAKKILTGNTTLSIDNAPVSKKKPENIDKSKTKLGILTKQKTKLKNFRLSLEVIEALAELTKAVNKKVNIKISEAQIIQLLITDAAKGNVDRVVKQINNSDNTND